ncbi:hypothetical protein [Phenylobacterium sp.]|jgi:hypothetical protein|uniref:hypothetical protein n=1 Tax=Phenylobacterium sp. TaxID=1871053 RepID=UPI002E31CEBD|nr:hypothetical protein [Phenylobacterium sp.]HEX3366121.1 hypothetical protein [Phenylobacterium sp.]
MTDARNLTPPLLTPRAVRHFGLAALEARASRTGQTVRAAARPMAQASDPTPVEAAPRPRRVVVRLWIPSTPIFLLLAPFALLLIPLLYLAPPLRRINCAAAVFVLGDALLALSGTVVDVDTPEALVRIRLF